MLESVSVTPNARATFSFHGATIEIQAADAGTLRADLATFGVGPASGNVQAEAPTPKPVKAASTARTAAAPAADAQETKVSSSDEPPADDTVLDYPVLQQAVFKLAAKSKEAAVALNASFGVKTMKDLDPAKRREALAAVNEKLTELEVA